LDKNKQPISIVFVNFMMLPFYFHRIEYLPQEIQFLILFVYSFKNGARKSILWNLSLDFLILLINIVLKYEPNENTAVALEYFLIAVIIL
jgi:hypothetical protein